MKKRISFQPPDSTPNSIIELSNVTINHPSTEIKKNFTTGLSISLNEMPTLSTFYSKNLTTHYASNVNFRSQARARARAFFGSLLNGFASSSEISNFSFQPISMRNSNDFLSFSQNYSPKSSKKKEIFEKFHENFNENLQDYEEIYEKSQEKTVHFEKEPAEVAELERILKELFQNEKMIMGETSDEMISSNRFIRQPNENRSRDSSSQKIFDIRNDSEGEEEGEEIVQEGEDEGDCALSHVINGTEFRFISIAFLLLWSSLKMLSICYILSI